MIQSRCSGVTPWQRQRSLTASLLLILGMSCGLTISATAVRGQDNPSVDGPVAEWLMRLQSPEPATRFGAAFETDGFETNPRTVTTGLVAAASHPDPYIRRCVAIALGEFTQHPEQSVPALIKAFRDSDPQVRQFAVASAIKIGGAAVPHLAKAMSDVSPVGDSPAGETGANAPHLVADYAAYALSRIDGPVVGALQEVSRNQKEYETEKLQEPAAQPLLRQLAELEQEFAARENSIERNEVRTQITGVKKQLGKLVYGIESVPPGYFLDIIENILAERCSARPNELLEMLRSNEPRLQHLALSTGRWGGVEEEVALPAFESILDGSDKELQALAVRSLGVIGPRAFPLLKKTLEAHPRPQVREAVAFAMRAEENNALSALEQALVNDKDSKVRIACVRAIASRLPRRVEWMLTDDGELAPQVEALEAPLNADQAGAVAALVKVLNEPDSNVVDAAIDALAGLKQLPADEAKTLISALVSRLESGDGNAQQRAAQALERLSMPVPAAVSSLVEGLKQMPSFPIGQAEFGSVQDSFVRALGAVGKGDASAEAALIEILNGSQHQLYSSCYDSLGKVGSAACIPRLTVHFEHFANTNNDALSKAAGNGLAQIEPEGISTLLALLNDPAKSVPVRQAACYALRQCQSTDDRVIMALTRAIKDTVPGIRRHAAHGLANRGQGVDEAIQVLSDAILQVGEFEHREIVQSLRKYPERANTVFLELLLSDRGEKTRQKIIEQLESIKEKDPRIISVLNHLKGLNPIDSSLRRLSIEELQRSQFRDPRFVSLLIRHLEHADVLTRAAAAKALVEIRPDESEHVVAGLVRMLDRETQAWNHDPSDFNQRQGLMAALDAVGAYGPRAEQALPSLMTLVKGKDVWIRERTIEVLRQFVQDEQAIAVLNQTLNDESGRVRSAAAAALLAIDEQQPQWHASARHAALSEYIDQALTPFLDGLLSLRQRAYVQYAQNDYHSAPTHGAPSLPPLPWPPPKWTHQAVFGRDFPRELLGNEQATLGDVEKRLYQALQRIDSRFESGLFSVPGGFAMLTRLERINRDGTPFPDERRWMYGELPPLSLSDYLSRLFFEQPGYFRVLAFVVTSEQYFKSGDSSLPPISAGGQILPQALKQLPFAGRNCFVLVYSFERRRGGSVKKYESLSSKIHLEGSGILGAIATP